jgi:hypothetical protein
MPSRSQQLQIKHIGYQDDEQNKPQFVVVRSPDLKSSAPVTLTGPDQTLVPGRPSSNLQQDLRWYLEQLLEMSKRFNIIKFFLLYRFFRA